MKRLKNIHPGEVLREEFLAPLEITQYALGKHTNISHSTISRIVNEDQSVTAEVALRIAKFLGTTPGFWLNLQVAYDLEEAERSLDKKEIKEIPFFKKVS